MAAAEPFKPETPVENVPTQASRLEAIDTRWSLIRRAFDDGRERQGIEARNALVMRYATAVRKYIGGILRNREEADELSQDALMRLLRGDFAGADPDRGRFRDLLKTAVRNMVRNHWAKENRRRPVDFELNLVADQDETLDREWLGTWQRTVLEQALHALREIERQHPAGLAHTLILLKIAHPEETSEQLAARLSAQGDKPIRADAFRQMLRRARLRLAELLVREAELGLEEPTAERIEDELAALGLMDHVREFLSDDWKQTGRLREA